MKDIKEEEDVQINIKLPSRLKKAAEQEATLRMISVSDLIRQLLAPFLPENVAKVTSRLNKKQIKH